MITMDDVLKAQKNKMKKAPTSAPSSRYMKSGNITMDDVLTAADSLNNHKMYGGTGVSSQAGLLPAPQTEAERRNYAAQMQQRDRELQQNRVQSTAATTPEANRGTVSHTSGSSGGTGHTHSSGKFDDTEPVNTDNQLDELRAERDRLAHANRNMATPRAEWESNNARIAEIDNEIHELGARTKGDFIPDLVRAFGAGVTGASRKLLDALSDYGYQQAINENNQNQAALLALGNKDAAAQLETDKQTMMSEGPYQFNYAQNFLDDTAKRIRGHGKVARVALEVAQGVGDMLPSIATNYIIPGSGLTVMFAQAAAGATREAMDNGADFDKAAVYGLAVGAVEVITEKISGGIPGTKSAGWLDNITDGFVNRIARDARAQACIKFIFDALEEGGEEFISEFADHAINQWTVKDDDRNWSEVSSDAMYSFLIGALTGAVLDLPANFIGMTAEQKRKTLIEKADEEIVKAAEQQKKNTQESNPQIAALNGEQETVQNKQDATQNAQEATQNAQVNNQQLAALNSNQPQSNGNSIVLPRADDAAVTSEEWIADYEKMQQDFDRLNAEFNSENITEERAKEILGKLNDYYEKLQSGQSTYEQMTRARDGKLSKNYGSEANHIDNRNFDTVSSRSVKAFQYDHPELHGYFVEAAKAMKDQLSMSMPAERGLINNGEVGIDQYVRRYGSRRAANSEIETLLDDVGLTYSQISKALDDIISNHGQENYAAAKKVEIVLSGMLTDGFYIGADYIAPNQNYINAISKIKGGSGVANNGGNAIMKENGTEVTDNGRGTQSIGGEERSIGLASAEQGTGVAERGAEAGTERSGAENGRRDIPQDYRSGVSLGIETAVDTDEDPTHTLRERTDYTAEEKALIDTAAKNGQTVHLYTGDLWCKDDNGNVYRVRGLIHGDGKTIWVKADHSKYSVQQVYDHENYHAEIKKNPAILQDGIKRIQKQYARDPAGLNDLIQTYVKNYRIDTTGMSVDDILEEILCDAHAGITVRSTSAKTGETKTVDLKKQADKALKAKETGKAKSESKASRESDAGYAPTFYSQMARTIDDIKQQKLGASSVVSYLRGRGVKAEEIKWSGIEAWLDGKKSVTKEELQAFAAASQLEIEETTLTNEEIPYTPEQQKQIAGYESERSAIVDELKKAWQEEIGAEFPIENPGMGLYNATSDRIEEYSQYLRQKSDVGQQISEARNRLKAIFEEDDFGYDSAKKAYMDAVRDPMDFINSFGLTGDQRTVLEEYAALKEQYKNQQGVPEAVRDRLLEIASRADEISSEILKIRNAHYKEAAKHMTKWGEYKTPGGENYREVLFRLPGSDYTNDAMSVHWRGSVAEDGGVLAHARLQDMPTADGDVMLFVEEIQSDWHNAGNKNGYFDGNAEEAIDRNTKEISALLKWHESVSAKERAIEKRIANESDNAEWVVYASLTNQESDYGIPRETAEEIRQFATKEDLEFMQDSARKSKRVAELRDENKKLQFAVPDAPFRDTYTDFVMKRLIRMAAENDYDSIGWTTAQQQDLRWENPHDKGPEAGVSGNLKGYTIEYDQDIPKFLNKYGKKWGAKVEQTQLENGDTVWQFKIPEAMKESVLYEGQAKYSRAELDDDIQKYGEMEAGENPARDVHMPNKTSDNRKLSQTVRTILEAKVTPDTMVPTIEDLASQEEFSYEVYGDKQAVSDAEAKLKYDGWDKSLEKWKSNIRSGKVSKKNTTMGWVLYNNAATDGNVATAIDILNGMVQHQRSAAQALQATRILKKMSPNAQLYAAVRSVQNIQDEMNEKYGEANAPKIVVDPGLAQRYLNAKTDEARTDALKDIYVDVGRQLPSRFRDRMNAWRYLAMLGNARTHVRNVIGNAGFAPIVMAKNLTATAIESAVSRVGNIDRTKALVSGKGGKEILSAAWNDFNKMSDVVMGDSKYADEVNANKEVQEGRVIFGNTKSELWNKTGGKALETLRIKNGDLLNIEDQWFSQPHYAYAMAQYCKANGITAEQIKSGKGLEKARDYAVKEAQKATYRDTNAFSQFVSSLGRNGKNSTNPVKKTASFLVEGILPFRKTPANILVRGMEYSPAGLIKALTVDLAKVKNGTMSASEAIDNIAAGLTGTGLMALGTLLTSFGLIRGHGSDDKKEADFEKMLGHQNYSLELPGGMSVTLDWLAPEAIPFFVGVNLWEQTAAKGEGVTFDTLVGAISNVSEPVLEMSCLQGLNNLFENYMYSSSTNGLTKTLTSASTSYLMQFVPTILGQLERTAQDKRMTTYTSKSGFIDNTEVQRFFGNASAKIPGWDYRQIPYIDAWGREESSGGLVKRALNNMLNPAYTSNVEISDMENELMRLYDATGEGGVFPSRADKSFTVDGATYLLSPDEYVRYAKMRGEAAYAIVTDLTESAAYQNMSDADKADAVRNAYQYAQEVAQYNIGGRSMTSWVVKAMDAYTEYRVPVYASVAAKALTNGVESLTDENGKSITNSPSLQKMEIIYNSFPGLSRSKLEYLFDLCGVGKSVIGYSRQEVAQALRSMR